MYFLNLFLILALVNVCHLQIRPSGMDMKSRLRRILLSPYKYDKLTSPVRYFNDSDTRRLTIGMSMLILHVQSLDEINGILTVNGWFFITWSDLRLQWNPEDYDGINVLHLEDKSIWVPDIMVYNNAESLEIDHYGNAGMKLHSTGTVYWFPPGTLRSTCPVDHKLYPFDEHLCVTSMGVWAYTSLDFNIHPLDKDHEFDVLDKYGTENPLWEVLERGIAVKNVTYSCCPGVTYLVVEVKVHLRRRSPFHKFMLIVPSFFAMCLTLAILWLPPDADVKFTLGATVLGIEVALLVFLGWQIPPGGNSIPAIVYFCGNAFMLTSLALIVAVVVRKLCRRVYPAVPENIMSILRGPAGTFLCLEPQSWKGWARFISKAVGQNQLIDEDRQQLDVGGDNNQVELGANESSPGAAESAKDIQTSDWYLVAVAVDRTTFVVYCLLFFLVLVTSFL